MKDAQIRNRAQAVEAMTQINSLRNLLGYAIRLHDDLYRQYDEARYAENLAAADELRPKISEAVSQVAKLRAGLIPAGAAVERIKRAICEEELRFRLDTARALAVKARLAAAPCEAELTRIMDGLKKDGYFDLPPESVPDEPDSSTPSAP